MTKETQHLFFFSIFICFLCHTSMIDSNPFVIKLYINTQRNESLAVFFRLTHHNIVGKAQSCVNMRWLY